MNVLVGNAGDGGSSPHRPVAVRWRWLYALTPRRVALLALLFYLPQVAWFTYPNEYAAMLARLLGLDPFRVPAHPVWQLLVAALTRLPGTSPSALLSLFQAACGAVVVGLVYAVASDVRIRRSKSRSKQAAYDAETEHSRRLAGLLAAVYAAVSLPTLIVFTRPHPLALAALLVMLSTWLIQRAWRQPARSTWYLFCAVYGLGCAEFPTFFLLAFPFGLGWLWLSWRHALWSRWFLPLGLACFFATYAVVLLACWIYFQSPVAEWRGFTTYFSVLHFFLWEQVQALRHGVPRVGWLTIGALMIAPGLGYRRSAQEEVEDLSPSRSLLLIRAALASVALVPLFDGVGSPWRLTGPAALVVTPYLITALWFGRLLSLVHWQLLQLPRSRRGRPARLQTWGVPALVVTAGLVLLGATARHGWMACAARARPLVNFADDLLADVGEGTWLITDGSLDSLLQLRAWEQGRGLLLLNRAMSRYPPYLRHLTERMPDAELRSVARAGLEPMLRAWGGRASFRHEVRVLDWPDVWVMQGYRAAPEGLVYTGWPTPPTGEEAGRIFTSTWSRIAVYSNVFGAARAVPPVEARTFRRVSRHLGQLANNLGVMMEDVERVAEAERAYRLALVFDANNASALCNLLGVAVEADPAEREALRSELRRVVRLRQLGPAQMVGDYGYIRDSGAYAQQALAWAAIGRSDSAVERAQQALDLAPTNQALQLLLAQVLTREEGQPSAELYEEILAKDPRNTRALLGLARLKLEARAFAEAGALLDRAEAAGVEPGSLAVDRAFWLVANQRRDEARVVLREAVRQDRTRAPAWLALALMALEDRDEAGASAAVAELQRCTSYAPGQLFLSDQALQRADPVAARAHLERAAAYDRGNPAIWERWATLEYVQGQMADAARRAGELLVLDPGNATAHYLLGMVHLQTGQPELAAAALRNSLKTRLTAPALNGLAQALAQQGEHEEALSAARRAVSMQPRQAAFWATLGRVLAEREEWTGAAASFDQALNLGYREPYALLRAAEVFLRSGQPEKTRRLLNYLEPRAHQVDADAAARFAVIKRDLPAAEVK
jgi:tetratricopeptide (TPR) repeat protein